MCNNRTNYFNIINNISIKITYVLALTNRNYTDSPLVLLVCFDVSLSGKETRQQVSDVHGWFYRMFDKWFNRG